MLGHTADNTVGNALETAVWMQQEGYRSLRLVTSWYHMHRSLLEFGRAMPRVRVVAHPVFAHDGEPEGWRGWLAAGQTRLRANTTSFSRPGCCSLVARAPQTPATPVIRTAGARDAGKTLGGGICRSARRRLGGTPALAGVQRRLLFC